METLHLAGFAESLDIIGFLSENYWKLSGDFFYGEEITVEIPNIFFRFYETNKECSLEKAVEGRSHPRHRRIFISFMKKKKQDYYSIFFHIPLYNTDVMVMVGAKNKEEVRYLLKKQRVNSETIKRWVENQNLSWLLKQEAGSLVENEKLEVIYHFRKWDGDDNDIRVLVHEVSHMVDQIAEAKNFVKETEARAYLSDYLFHTIKTSL